MRYYPSSTTYTYCSTKAIYCISTIYIRVFNQDPVSSSSSHQISDQQQDLLISPSSIMSSSDNRVKRHKKSNSPGTTRAPTAPQKFRCEICNREFSRKDNLKTHQRVHSGERPFTCKYCGQTFRWVGSWHCHEANHVRDGDRVGSTPPATKQLNTQYKAGRIGNRGGSSSSTSVRGTSRSKESRGRGGDRRVTGERSDRGERHRRSPRSGVVVTDEDPAVDSLNIGPWHDVLSDNGH